MVLPDSVDPSSNGGWAHLSLEPGQLLLLPDEEDPLSVSLNILGVEAVEESDSSDSLLQSQELLVLLSLWSEVDKSCFPVLDSLPIFLGLDQGAWPFESRSDEFFDVLASRV